MTPISRRRFLQSSLGLLLTPPAVLGCSDRARPIPGEILGASAHVGHLLRPTKENSGPSIPAPTEERRADVVIVGGGIAGLSAAWWLKKSGITDLLLLELHSEVGGNSLSGQNAISRYPWGAHYVPIANRESRELHDLFVELGVIEGFSGDGKPIYREEYLCAAPEERLYKDGRWQEGLLPTIRATTQDHEEYRRFFDLIERFRTAVGADGKRAFAIPLERSSQDSQFTALDTVSFLDFITDRGFSSAGLLWYLDYCCRDDYGCKIHGVSAWAGIHYFAARDGWSANSTPHEVLTWPEGNGWLVHRLRERVQERIVTNSLVYRITQRGSEVVVTTFNPVERRTTEVQCQAVLFAAPRFTAPYIIESLQRERPAYLREFHYSPWLVANLHLNEPPDGLESELAWDNVLYGSNSLGYVVATHQHLTPQLDTVLTYYLPLTGDDPRQVRQWAATRTHGEWCEEIVRELQQPHPRIREKIARADLWLWGHGMIQPRTGFLWGKSRADAVKHTPPLFFAHSDMSGLSLFEEAHFRGVEGAKGIVQFLGGAKQAEAIS